VKCPYVDCLNDNLPVQTERCPQCGRRVKHCRSAGCVAANRIFSVYCCNCGVELPVGDHDWPVFRGSPQRTGTGRPIIHRRLREFDHQQAITEIGSLTLPDRCRSLLIYDGCLFAFSSRGMAKVADVSGDTVMELASFSVGGNIFAEPALHRGSLFVGTENRLFAYTLGKLFDAMPGFPERWTLPIPGTPIQSLLPVEDRLYVTLSNAERPRDHELHILDGIHGRPTNPPQILHAGPKVSTLAADVTNHIRRVFFLSGERNRTVLHTIRHQAGSPPSPVDLEVEGAPGPFDEIIQITLDYPKLFVVFKQGGELFTVNTITGKVEQRISGNVRVRNFAIAGARQAVLTSTNSISIPHLGMTEPLSPDEVIIGHPLILRDFTIVAGMQRGMLKLYDIRNLSIKREWRASSLSGDLTALVPFKNMIIAGDSQGRVVVGKLNEG
jgi:hypothetical protein